MAGPDAVDRPDARRGPEAAGRGPANDAPGGDFVWRDAGRTVIFRGGLIAEAPQVLAGYGFGGFELFSTARGRADVPDLVAAAAAIHDVAPGPVADAAAALVNEVGGELPLVALGGGRVIDAAKAVASLRGLEVATVATTMSGAEMTDLHALPEGRHPARGRLRPTLVLADPEAMTSAPEASLRVSSMNALAHGADSLYTPFANPMSRHAALRGAALIGRALDEPRGDRDPDPPHAPRAGRERAARDEVDLASNDPGSGRAASAPNERRFGHDRAASAPDDPSAGRDRRALALGSILCGYAIDSGRLGIHHVVCQTLAGVVGTPHAQNNAAVLPHALAYLVAREAAGMAELAAALDTDRSSLPARITALGEPVPLGSLDTDPDLVPPALDAMLARRELSFAPGPPTRDDLAAIVDAAW
jgi:alcohol dehydrogenase class IV